MFADGKVVIAVPVRMGSSRLPGKILREVNGTPLLGYLVERLQNSSLADEIVVAISDNPDSDPIEEYCKSVGVAFYRGSENHVLERLYGALKQQNAVIGGLVYGDCPLIDPRIVDKVIAQFAEYDGLYDFVSNDLKTTYPPGMEIEVFKMDVLEHAYQQASDSQFKEHATLYIRSHPDTYRLMNLEAPRVMYYPDMEIEVDDEKDFQVIESIIKNFSGNKTFSLMQIIDFLVSNPDISDINRNVHRRWKEFRDEC